MGLQAGGKVQQRSLASSWAVSASGRSLLVLINSRGLSQDSRELCVKFQRILSMQSGEDLRGRLSTVVSAKGSQSPPGTPQRTFPTVSFGRWLLRSIAVVEWYNPPCFRTLNTLW